MTSSSVGVTLRRSFSPPLPSSCIPGGSGRVPAFPRGAEPPGQPVGDGDPLAVGGLSLKGVNSEVGLVL